MLKQASVLILWVSASLVAAQTSRSLPLRMPGKTGDDHVAQMIEDMRSQHGLHPLKRQKPSREEVQLVCSAAATGKIIHEPKFGALQIYFAHDISEEPEGFKVVALGTSFDAQNNTRYSVYADKDWGHFSVVVFATPPGRNDSRTYAIGVARHTSRIKELLAPMTFDHPVSNSEDWKKHIATECRNAQP